MPNDNPNRSPLLRACPLWEAKTQKGDAMLRGGLGDLKVLVMRNRDHEREGDPTHVFLFGEAPSKQDRDGGGKSR
jgi:hypothetical protein